MIFFLNLVIIHVNNRGTSVISAFINYDTTYARIDCGLIPRGERKIFIMTIRPLSDRVVLKMTEAEESTASGIILSAKSKEKPQVAEVISVGPGGVVDGEKVEMTVKPGDKVLTSKYSGTEVKIDGEEYVIVRIGDILAVCE